MNIQSLRLAFKDTVKPKDYLVRVWLTAVLVSAAIFTLEVTKGGTFNINTVLPLGPWHPRNPLGSLYVEIWSTIVINSLQTSFGVWSVVLAVTGAKRLLASNKYVFACFSTALAFAGLAAMLPSMVQPLLQMLIDRLPFLVN